MSEILQRLRILAAGDPKSARELVESLLDGDSQELQRLLDYLAAPGEGRLRQLVANTARKRPDRQKVVPHLLRWMEQESDEFARTAIQWALDGIDTHQRRQDPSSDPPGLVHTYRYVADRLCHKVRNALPGPVKHIRQIEDLAKQAVDPVSSEILAAAGQLRDSLRMVSHVVEFDTGDDYFEWRPVNLAEWLETAGREYNTRNEAIELAIKSKDGQQGAVIQANNFLLEIIFWNLWRNARQAVDGSCQVNVSIDVEPSNVILLVSDNGNGLPWDLADYAFEDCISTQGGGRGRGLLEIADAVYRLSGQVKVVDLGSRGHRIQMTFPRET